ncbi:ABC transporter substrate-binding protein [Anaeromyxobacter diazotrophicus]|uniref:ABC transporter permease n=1 Tax=Anaeromyxobacter diazotrophicus TaxID=2590199 RepID=A0A7I9VKW5_9BACT|nr:ABC transporter substrate-binding protein [Anaeromyxobacter diazotrophicus]GEJ57053.1 ABC transporter permease [Anaeromyxobacter diazotrophicus]
MKKTVSIALLLALAAPAGVLAQGKGISDGVVKLGVLTDMTGYYSDLAGPGSVLAAKMAVEDFGGKVDGKPIQVVSADHQLKADVASNTARKWIDEQQVDALVDLVSSSTALAVMPIVNEKKRIALFSGPGTTAITGDKCNPYTVHYTYNNWALANGTGREVVEQGGKSWFFITADYAFGKSLEEDTSAVVKAAGGKVLGSVRFPSPGTTDFSSYVLQAQSSGAQIIGLANAGQDTVNSIKAATEYGLTKSQKLAGLLIFISDIHSLGLQTAQGLYATTAFYWDHDDASRKWAKRFQSHPDNKKKAMPTMVQAGVYSSVRHYLEAVKAAHTDDADAVMAKMRELPVNDFFAQNGRIGPDGLHRHDMYLVQVKTPKESKGPWDYYKILKTIPASQAFPSVEAQKCPIAVKK